jgi:hypothetical protein
MALAYIDLNHIQAIIAQEPLDELMKVKKLVDMEIDCAKQREVKREQVRAVPRFDQINGIAPVHMSVEAEIERNYKSQVKGEPLHVSNSGATSSHVPLRYDLIPSALLDRAAERYTLGVKIHTERGYQRGLNDREFIVNRINHIQEHWNKLLHPDYSKANEPEDEDGVTAESINKNLGAILWGIGFLCEVAANPQTVQQLLNLRIEGRVLKNSGPYEEAEVKTPERR